MESMLVWGLLLITAAFLLLAAELFLPTGGLLGVIAACLAVAGIVCMFRESTTWGAVGLLGVLVLGPMAIGFALKIWPSTPLGKRILGVPSEEEAERLRLAEEAERKEREALLGQEGIVLVDLRPVGMVEIGGRRFDAISEIQFVPAGSRVKVSGFSGNDLRVRPLITPPSGTTTA
jgi:membrane-bound ClpP family serine protease